MLSGSATSAALPIILIRGFGGADVEDVKADAYQGFNTGTVYPKKTGENYIYEGMLLQFMKATRAYTDATNVVRFYGSPQDVSALPAELATGPQEPRDWHKLMAEKGYFSGKVVLGWRNACLLLERAAGDRAALLRTVWVFRYYDLNCRKFDVYGQELRKLIAMVCDVTGARAVNIIAHSMGGLVTRAALQAGASDEDRERINKIVTLGTPHKGIAFQYLPEAFTFCADEEELDAFNPTRQGEADTRFPWAGFKDAFPLDRLLCVVGTDYRSYDHRVASLLNRLFSIQDGGAWAYNKSDGLVKQWSAIIDGADVAYVHKCHGGRDSLVTSREAYELASRFFHGTHRVRLMLTSAEVRSGADWFGKSEYYLGVSVRPRGVDFDLNRQDRDTENCFGPFIDRALKDYGSGDSPLRLDAERCVYAGFLDGSQRMHGKEDLVFRVQFYIGERDLLGVGFSDEEVLNLQCYVQGVEQDGEWTVKFHRGRFEPGGGLLCQQDAEGRWLLDLDEPGFKGTFALEVTPVSSGTGEP